MRTTFPRASHFAAAALKFACAASGNAAPAATGNSCLWARLPPDRRKALTTAYVDHGQDGLGAVTISDGTVRAVAAACGGAPADAPHLREVSVGIAGAAMRHGAERVLMGYGVSSRTLDRAWRSAAAQRRALAADVEHGDHSPESAKALYTTVAGLIRKAGGSVPDRADPLSDPVFHAYADYFLGRALEARASSATRE